MLLLRQSVPICCVLKTFLFFKTLLQSNKKVSFRLIADFSGTPYGSTCDTDLLNKVIGKIQDKWNNCYGKTMTIQWNLSKFFKFKMSSFLKRDRSRVKNTAPDSTVVTESILWFKKNLRDWTCGTELFNMCCSFIFKSLLKYQWCIFSALTVIN